MKATDYWKILASIEQALTVCDESWENKDETHKKICEDLHATRQQLIELLNAPPPSGGGKPGVPR
jgi:hypothetical protein